MPADIRNFFGGKPSATPIRPKEAPKTEEIKKKRGSRKVVEDSDDDEVEVVKKSASKPPPKKAVKQESPKGKETTTDDYFASSTKGKPAAKTTTPVKPKPETNGTTNGRTSARKKTTTSYSERKDDDDLAYLDDGSDAGDDIHGADFGKGKKNKDDYVEIESDDEPVIQPKKSTAKPASKSTPKATPRAKKVSKKEEDVEMKDADAGLDSDDLMIIEDAKDKPHGKKRKSVDLESEDDEDDTKPKIKSVKSTTAKPPPAKKRAPAKPKEKAPESSAIQDILNNIPTVRAPTPPPKDESAKFDWRKGGGGGGNAGPPPAAGAKEIPEGEDNCLAGMTFVFTGLLETISRDEGVALVKRYGGKTTTAPSKNTSFVVLGNEAGPSKLRKIAELKIKTINEDGLFALIKALPANGGDGKAAEKNNEKKRLEAEKIKQDAEEMDREEKRKAKEAEKAEQARQKALAAGGSSSAMAPPPKPVDTSSLLWTSRYAPNAVNQICGNKGAVEKIQNWLKGWQTAHKYNFQKKGADGMGGYRAIIIHGPPGIGKTTAAHLAAKLTGYDVLESNASDTRSKKLVETGLHTVLNNKSLLGYFAGDGKAVDKNKQKIVLIMDEVDGMSAGDRGGVGALAKVCKTTDIPMILICNERRLPKMKPFDFITMEVPFRRPTVEQVRSRIATICMREGLKLPTQVIDALIEGSNKDIRQIINMISTIKLDQTAMDFDQSKSMTKAWEKHVVLKPWDIAGKLLGGSMFHESSKATLNDKIELYFNDHEFTPLMIQENYLNTKPHRVTKTGKQAQLQALRLFDKAAESISDGDLVDRMIHGSQQQWSLMPTHAVFSSVRPASFIAGNLSGQTSFTKWLGNNSKQGKLSRYVKELQSHMRLRSSGDRHEIRQQYLPVLWTRLIKRLENEGKDAVDDVIDLMDSYYLTRDDFDYIMELGLGPQDMESVSLETQTKASFTRQYNARSHPVQFMKASSVIGPAKVAKQAPDLEEAFEEEDDGEEIAPVKEEDDELDLKKDKYIKQPKAKKAPAKKATKKKAVKDEDDGEEEEEDVKPKKKRAPAKSKAKK